MYSQMGLVGFILIAKLEALHSRFPVPNKGYEL